MLVLPAAVCVDDLPAGSGGVWEWVYEVAVVGKACRIDFAGYGRPAAPEELVKRATVLRMLARTLELTAALSRATGVAGGRVQSSQELAAGVKWVAERGGEQVHGVELVCGTCGVAFTGAAEQLDCTACGHPLDPGAARKRAVATDPTPVPPAPADDEAMF